MPTPPPPLAMARATTTALLLLLLLLAALLSAAAQPVLDLDGKEVQLDGRYLLRRSIPNRIVGGLSLRSIYGSCPKYVADGFELDRGLPAVFYPGFESPAGFKVLLEFGMRVNIQFPTAQGCKDLSNYWLVDSSFYVVIGGQKGGEITSSWFYFTRGSSPRSHGLDFCPCLRCSIACFTVGRAADGAELVLNGEPMEITLEKIA